MKVIHRNHSIHTGHTRDAALRRLRQANRWLLAGSAILTGVLTDAAANAFPGHTIAKGARAKTAAARGRVAHKPLSAPAQAPQASTGATSTQGRSVAPSESRGSSRSQAPAESSASSEAGSSQASTPETSGSEQSQPAESTHSTESTQRTESSQPAESSRAAAPVEEEHSEPVVSGGS